MSHIQKILQTMKPGEWHTAESLSHLGMHPDQVRAILKQLAKGNIVDCEDEGFRKRKVYKTKQKDLFLAPSQALIDDCKTGETE